MPDASSIIKVSIIGDAKKLIGALDKADGGVKGFAKKAGSALVGLAVVDQAFDFLGGALDNADKVGDAMSRLEFTVGKVNAEKLHDVADSFTKMGLSEPEMLGLEGAFADIGAAIGLNADTITSFADDVVVIADKLHDTDPDNKSTAQFVDAIGKAAGGATKPLKDLGIAIDEAAVTSLALHDSGKDNPKMLTDSEKAAARFKIIMEKLNPILGDAASGTADLRDRQDELAAKFDTLSTKVGEGIKGPLTDLLGVLNDEYDGAGRAGDGFLNLGLAMVVFEHQALDALRPVGDALSNIIGLAGDAVSAIGGGVGGAGGRDAFSSRATGTGGSDRRTAQSIIRTQERNGIRTGGIGASLGGP